METQRKAYRWHPDVAAAIAEYAASRRLSETEALEQLLIAAFDLTHLQVDPKAVQRARALKPVPIPHVSELRLSALSSFMEQLRNDGVEVLIGNDGPHLAIVLVNVNQCETHSGFWREGWCPTCAKENS